MRLRLEGSDAATRGTLDPVVRGERGARRLLADDLHELEPQARVGHQPLPGGRDLLPVGVRRREVAVQDGDLALDLRVRDVLRAHLVDDVDHDVDRHQAGRPRDPGRRLAPRGGGQLQFELALPERREPLEQAHVRRHRPARPPRTRRLRSLGHGTSCRKCRLPREGAASPRNPHRIPPRTVEGSTHADTSEDSERAGRGIPARRRAVPARAARHRGFAPPLDRAEPGRPPGRGGRPRRAVRRGPRRRGRVRPLVAAAASPRRCATTSSKRSRAAGRVFFTGCGATGRLSIQLASIWRAFWQDRRERGLATPPPDAWEGRAVSVMAGGDYALIKSVEGFEDFAPFGRKQIADLGVSSGRHGLRHHRGRRDVLRDRHRVAGPRGRRPRRLRLQQPRRGAAGPREAQPRGHRRAADPEGQPHHRPDGHHRLDAHAGHEHRAAGHAHRARDGAARGPRPRRGARSPGLGPSAGVPEAMRAGLRAVHARADGRAPAPRPRAPRRGRGAGLPPGRPDLLLRRLPSRWTCSPTPPSAAPRSARPPSASGTTRRPPSRGRSCSPPRRRARRPGHACSVASRRRSSGRRRTCARSSTRRRRRGRAAILGEIGRRELLRFRIGLDGLPYRPARAGDGVTAVVAESDLPLLEDGGAFARAARAGAGGRGLRGGDRRGPGGRARAARPRRPRPAEATG